MKISVIQINPKMLTQIKMTILNQNEIHKEVEVNSEKHHVLTKIVTKILPILITFKILLMEISVIQINPKMFPKN
jgi:hypothetical protein